MSKQPETAATPSPRSFGKVLCANRGEIAIRVFRACTELGMQTVAIFSDEDRTQLFRYKADEAYLVGKGKKPVDAYLGIEEILEVAGDAGADAIHPGYGFLSENPDFASACEERGIVFIGPRPETMQELGDKVRARRVAEEIGVPTIPGLTVPLDEADGRGAARAFCEQHGSVIVKAVHGGGGRGMRLVHAAGEMDEAIEQASREARAAFGSGEVFLEKYLSHVRHTEVQILGDHHGHLVHLHERDCSVQRRHQKVIEVAPAPHLGEGVRRRLHEDALRIARKCGYTNAGTVEFLVSGEEHYFIEVNPRLQVEHTVTEVVTGIDIVQAQIRIAEGHPMASPLIGVYEQEEIVPRGFAIQCRITTEDPGQGFLPDTGSILAYRSASGFGIRLDAGNAFPGAYVSPHYDSLLVKLTSFARTLRGAANKGLRALAEFRIRGVKTNIQFLENVLEHETFLQGKADTRFIDETPGLFDLEPRRDRATKLLLYLAEIVVNGHPTIKEGDRLRPSALGAPVVPTIPDAAPPSGTAEILDERGPEGLARWVLDQKKALLTDTTMRDAHQSLLATRVRTRDLTKIAAATAHFAPDLFSLEVWGGATFDVAYRFLNEDPWERLRQLKEQAPNILLQMLLRGANAVGYTSYPDNLVEAFIDEAAQTGVDVFRVFDSLNDLENMRVSVERIKTTGKVAEISMCYTGDVANERRTKYGLGYYVDLARRIEDMGSHILCIKDMAGLIRPQAAEMLIDALKEVVQIPIHLHTHDTSGNGITTLTKAIESGVDIVDVALAPMAGMTSQPSLNALVAALHGSDRETGMRNRPLQPLADYWEAVRDHYSPFECGLKSNTPEVYYHEIPGGQYSNLRPQVASLGLLHRWSEVKDAFAVVNRLVGDIPKVTPSSKMVGDFATFLVQNDLLTMAGTLEESVDATRARVLEQAPRLDFPQSIVTYFQGHLGQPPGGFPQELREAVLKGQPVVEGRPGEHLEPLDLNAVARDLERKHGVLIDEATAISAALYPRVLDDYLAFFERHADVSILESPTYFYGLEPEQEIWVDLEPGKTLVIKLLAVSDTLEDGTKTVYFELNGQGRHVSVPDRSVSQEDVARRKADKSNPEHVGASMPGTVLAHHCTAGDTVTEGDPLLTLEAMKMETVIRAPNDGQVVELLSNIGDQVQAEDLLLVLR